MLLKLGSTGAEVKELQAALGCNADGIFGHKTELAVKEFQAKSGLAADGIVGPMTLAKLKPAAEPSQTYKPYTLAWYTEMFRTMTFDHGYESQIAGAAHRVYAGKRRYEAFVAAHFPQIPWYFIGSIHNLECSCNWRGVLHNGELIVGTDRKTKLVPAGRGPFATWEDAAIDAIKIEGIDKIGDWSIGNLLRWLENFNGRGYQKRGENTPYLWAMSSVNDDKGKYVRDNVYDPNANANTQVGAATLLKWLELNGLIGVTA